MTNITPYGTDKAGLLWFKPSGDDCIAVRLTNFTAEIVSEVLYDDGVEQRRWLELRAEVGGRRLCVSLSAEQFDSMSWPIRSFGAAAVVYAGTGKKDHARAAIQLLSRPATRVVYAHAGWRKLPDGTMAYVHAGGAIGAGGSRREVTSHLPNVLHEMRLPDPPTPSDRAAAVSEAMRLLELGPAELMIPLFGAVWRAVIAPCDFALHISGPSGVFKSEIAALLQQFFGAGFDSRHLPGNWSSTENALEALAFAAKDALLVVDDFAPAGTPADAQRLHQKAERIIRAQGNNCGRQRLSAEGALLDARPPRGLILSTGEDVPQGFSIRARMLVFEVGPGHIRSRGLDQCQAAARDGIYARAMSGFLKWLAPQVTELQDRLPQQVGDLRSSLATNHMHGRSATAGAHLLIGLELFFEFAQDSGVITAAERSNLSRRARQVVARVVHAQHEHQRCDDPARRFIELLGSAIARGEAHVAAADDGGVPDRPTAWGWRTTTPVTGRTGFTPMGPRVGWVSGETLYLDPESALKAANRAASGCELNIGAATLTKRLGQRGLLARESQRDEWKVRRTIDGVQRRVVQLLASTLMPVTDSAGCEPATTAIPVIPRAAVSRRT